MRDVPEPRPGGPTDVRVRVLEVGVCGTDREIVHAGAIEAPAGDDGLVLGHEALVEVTEPAPGPASLRAGDLAVPMVRLPCARAECTPCRVGRQDFCLTGEYRERGIKGAHGFMADAAVVPAEHLVAVPRALREVAVLTEPLTIAEKALDQADRVQARLPAAGRRQGGGHELSPRAATALVLGAGAVGLLGAMALVVRRYRTVVYSREPPGGARARIVAAIGAEYVSAAEVPLAGAVHRLGPVDLVYEATGAARVAFDAVPLLGPNGLFVLTGIPGRRGPVELDLALVVRQLVLRNQALLGSVNAGPEHFAAAIRDLALFHASWPRALASVLTARSPLGRAAEALHDAGPGSIKHVVDVAAGG